MKNNNTKIKSNKGLSKEMYKHIIDNVDRLKSIDIENGIVETARGTNGFTCSSTGYTRVNLGGKNVQVHSILAVLTYKEKAIGKQVNHRNGIKTDNSKNNLEIVTQKENLQHQWDTGLSKPMLGSVSPNAKLTKSQIKEIREKHTPLVKSGKGTPKSLAKEYGVSHQTISAIVANERYKDVI